MVTETNHAGPPPAIVKEHPEPKLSTVKQLYGSALRCAKPGCPRPLYNQDNDTGDLILNSRIAHIHARRPGGPRWIEMSSEDNRANANLLLLCIEHSYEVDDASDRFPAEMLRQWKQGQLEEYQRVERGWPLNDADAGRVLEASSRPAGHHSADAVLSVVRAVERLTLTARRVRSVPANEATAWRASRARARSSFTGWDRDGNSIHAEPSSHETRQHKTSLERALAEAGEALAPLAEEAKVELSAVGASQPSLEPWSAWVFRAIDEVLAASGTWPGPPDLEEDSRLEGALAGLAEARDAVVAAWRGEKAPQPPAEPDSEASSALEDPLREHRALLDRARPYARVDHRSYDPVLRAELAAAAEQAASIPPVASALAVGLSATCGLAAAVAANASDDQLDLAIREDLHRRPLSAAVLLLAENARVAEKRGRSVPQQAAEATLADLWNSIDWASPSSWDPDDANVAAVLWAGSRITSVEDVRDVLSHALERRPEILPRLILACADWVEEYGREDWNLLRIRRRYRELPMWFPVRAVVEAAASVAPIHVDEFGETDHDDADSLLAQVIHIAEKMPS